MLSVEHIHELWAVPITALKLQFIGIILRLRHEVKTNSLRLSTPCRLAQKRVNETFHNFWATVCETVRPMLLHRCLSVLSVLSVTLVYCGQTVWRIKMSLGADVGLGPGHIVLDGDPAPPPKSGTGPHFSAHVYCGQMAGWIEMPLGHSFVGSESVV